VAATPAATIAELGAMTRYADDAVLDRVYESTPKAIQKNVASVNDWYRDIKREIDG